MLTSAKSNSITVILLRQMLLCVRVLALLNLGLILCSSLWAMETVLDEDEIKLERLKDITRARELYVIGETCYKRGFLEEAIRHWMQALELKPDSEYTRKYLKKARAELLAKYSKLSEGYIKQGDFLSAYIVLDTIAHLIPENESYTKLLSKVQTKLTDDARKVIDAYNEARSHFAARNYPKAKEAIDRAMTHGRTSRIVFDAAAAITEAYNANRYTVEKLPPDLFTTREVAFENYFWLHEKTITLSIPTPDRGSVNKSIGVFSLRGRLRNITLSPLTKVTIYAYVFDTRTNAKVAEVEGSTENLKPGTSTEIVFTKFTGNKVLATFTYTYKEDGKNLSATTQISKTTQIQEREAVAGYASLDDKEDISQIYRIKAYHITTERAGTSARVEQYKPSIRIKKNY